MKKQIKQTKFKTEDAERNFWSDMDLTAHFEPKDFSSASFPNLKPTSRSVSIRMPEHLYTRLKERANELNVPYQTLMKQYIARGVEIEKMRR